MGLRRAYKNWKARREALLTLAHVLPSLTALPQPSASYSAPPPIPPRQRPTVYLGDRTVLTETFFGRKIYLDASDAGLTPHIIWDGEWEGDLTRFIERELKPGQVFVDIGAHCGYFTLWAAHLVGADGAVIALEPQEKLSKLLRSSLHVNGFERFCINITAAAADATGTAMLAKRDFLSGSASLRGLGRFQDSEEGVRVAPLGDLLTEAAKVLNRPVTPDLIKIDAEGYEYFIWQGARDVFAACERLTIYMEFSPLAYKQQEQSPRAFLNDILADGFVISQLNRAGQEKALTETDLDRISYPKGQHDLILRKTP